MKSLLHEIEALRLQVHDCDLQKFDQSIAKSKQLGLDSIYEYSGNISVVLTTITTVLLKHTMFNFFKFSAGNYEYDNIGKKLFVHLTFYCRGND